MSASWFEGAFPNLRSSGYRITSPESPEYNCIAWAAQDTERWWWPDPFDTYYWPQGVSRQETVAAFVQAYAELGFIRCESNAFEPGVEKIAIYVDSSGKPTHAARQLPSGKWTSKLGESEDIEHLLDGLISPIYGLVACILKRPLRRAS